MIRSKIKNIEKIEIVMPVSPADFEFYSRMTGRPIPADPAARMRMAPEVYAMRRGPLNRVAGALGSAAKAALMGGAVVGGGLLVKNLVEGMGQEAAPSTTTSDVNLDSPKATSAPQKGPEIGIEKGVHGFRPDSGEELIGHVDPAKVAAFRARISHQTVVPQADPNIANESFDAQRASVSEPTAPIKGGVSTQGQSAVDNVVAQAAEFFEGTGKGVSPFQAGGAMNELARQSRQVKETVGDLPKGIRGDVARFLSNLGSAPAQSAAPAATPTAAREFTQQVGRMSERDQVQYQGGLAGGKPGGIHGALEGSQDAMGDAPLGGMAASKSMMGEMLKRGNVLPNAGAIMSGIGSAPAPGPVDPLTGDYRAFVSDKGRQVGAVLSRAQKKEEAPKVDPRLQEITATIRKYRANLSPDEQNTLIQKLYKGESL